MFNEFEKIVLKKFDTLTSKIEDNSKLIAINSKAITVLSDKVEDNSKAIDTLSNKVENNSKAIDTLSNKVENNSKSIAVLSDKVENNSKSIAVLSDKVENNSKAIDTLSNKVENNSKAIDTLSNKVEQQGLNFASFENEFNIKVQSLFDSFVSNEEKHVSYSKAISALNAESFRQSVRISVLEDNYKNSKLFN